MTDEERRASLESLTHILCDRMQSLGSKRMAYWQAVFAVLRDDGDSVEEAVRLADEAMAKGLDADLEAEVAAAAPPA